MKAFLTKHDWHLTIKGYILYATVDIERKLDIFLSNHFCENETKKRELNELLFQNERVTFDFKRDIASIIVNSYYSDFKKHKNTLLSDLSNIAPHRNRFAHLENLEGKSFEDIVNGSEKILDPTNTDITISNRKSEYLLIFKRFKNGKPQYFGYDEIIISKIENLFNRTSNSLDLLINTEASRISTHA